jgi:sugar/nucleoside kinase (ribokinase family)
MHPAAEITALAVGQVTHDRYGGDIVPGGCAFYAARTFAALGARTGLATGVGEDFVCDDGLAGLEVMRAVSGKTTVFVNTYPDDGPRIQWNDASAPELAPAVLDPRWSRPDVAFLAPVFGEVDLAAWTGAIRGRVFGLGLQGFLKQAGNPHPEIADRRHVVARPFEIDAGLLEGVDAVFLSEEDIDVFGTETLLDDLRSAVPLVSLTRGERGSRVFLQGETIEVGVAPCEVVDPTGAGDTYAAAFLFALARGDSPTDAARLAAAAASIVVEGRGGATLHRVGEAFGRRALVPSG